MILAIAVLDQLESVLRSVLKWLGPLGGWIFRRGMYKKYYAD